MTRNADRLRLRGFFVLKMTPWIGAFVGYVWLCAFTTLDQYRAGTSHNGTCANCTETARYASDHLGLFRCVFPAVR